MSEGFNQNRPESVWWINAHERPDKIERVRQWLFKIASGGQTYLHKDKIPFSTVIPVAEIESLSDEQLRTALLEQKDSIANGDSFITIPVATVSTREFKHAWSVRVERATERAEPKS
jgi:hypothetical protein